MNVPQGYLDNYPGQLEEKVRSYFEEDVRRLNDIISAAKYAPCFRGNKKLCKGHPSDSYYQIPYNLVMERRLVICRRGSLENGHSYWSPDAPEIVKEYNSAEAVFGDGWLFD